MNGASLLQEAATFAALVTAAAGAWKAGQVWWRQSIGARRAQQQMLELLAVGANVDFIEQHLGVARYVMAGTRCYELVGALVTVVPDDGAVAAFSITCTDRKHWVEIAPLTRGHLPYRLGRTRFAQVTIQDRGCWKDYRAAGRGCWREFWFARAGGYLVYWLGNDVMGDGPSTASDQPSACVNSLVVCRSTGLTDSALRPDQVVPSDLLPRKL